MIFLFVPETKQRTLEELDYVSVPLASGDAELSLTRTSDFRCPNTHHHQIQHWDLDSLVVPALYNAKQERRPQASVPVRQRCVRRQAYYRNCPRSRGNRPEISILKRGGREDVNTRLTCPRRQSFARNEEGADPRLSLLQI